MPILGFPLRNMIYCIIMTDSEREPFTDETLWGSIKGVSIHSPSIFSPHYASKHLDCFSSILKPKLHSDQLT